MKISFKALVIFILLAVLSSVVWHKLEYRRFVSVDLSVDKKEALSIADTYLHSLGVDAKEYRSAIIFDDDGWADRYLQKTIGPDKEEEFLGQENFDLFYWNVRFFKELQKEEYSFKISAKTGNIISFEHLIEDVAKRDTPTKELAKERAEKFIENTYGFNLDEYELHNEEATRHDFRTDYSFSWEKKGVYIPWGDAQQGGAKILSGVTVSGSEIRSFYVNGLDVPESFKRYISKQVVFGAYISSMSFILFAIIIAMSIYVVLRRKHTFIIRICKKPVLYLALFLVIINLAHVLNNMQGLIMGYSTTSSLISYIWLQILKSLINIIILSVAFVFPALAGEYLLAGELPAAKYSSLSHYIKSTVYSRSMAFSIAFGYILFFIMLGLQAAIFYFGQRYAGVWREWSSLVTFSSAYVPFLGGLIIGVSASLNEEIIFRLFGISLAKKYLKNIVLAVIFSSLVWGFGHSGYSIYPVWFRGLEVSVLGLFFGFIFVKYGLIPLLVAHYLFDAFWGCAPYILGRAPWHIFLGSIVVLILPLVFAAIAYLRNKHEREREIKLMLDTEQEFNLGVLAAFIAERKSNGVDKETLRSELLKHNWDADLVGLAIKEIFKH